MLSFDESCAIGFGSAFIVLAAIHFYRLFKIPPQFSTTSLNSDIFFIDYDPILAWTRTGIYLVTAVLFCIPTGFLAYLTTHPIVSSDQSINVLWIFATIACFLLEFLLFWFLWPRWTIHFNRIFQWIPCICFGIAEGISNGLVICNVWYIFHFIAETPLWANWIAVCCIIGIWQWIFGQYYWNVYVLPEIDTPWSLKMKTFACNIPNVMITLTYLIFWRNAGFFVIFQTIAMLGCALRIRFPSPWTTRKIEGATCKRGIFGFPVAIGAQGDDQSVDEEEITEALNI
jgi:hypothetical protein